MKKRLISILLCGVLVLSLAACGSKEGTKKEEAKTEETTKGNSGEATDKKYGLDMDSIVVAISSGYEPFCFDKDNELQGYDVDMWKEFEERTGIKVKWERADFSGLLGLLDSGKADVVAAQLTPTPEREEKYAFTEPETYYGSVIVVSNDNTDIKSADDLAGKTIGVGAGNEMQQDIEAMYPNGEVKFEIYQSATLENMLKDVEMGRIDGMLAQDIQAYMAIEKSGVKCKVVTPAFESSCGALAVKKDNTELLDGLNAFIKEIKEDGTLKAISEKWIGADVSVESK